MVKSTQIKIILIIVLLAILMFGSFGAYSIIRLNNLQTSIVEKDILMQEINEIKLVLAIITISFIIISFVIMWFSRKIISQPILRLIQSAKQINEENRNAEAGKSDIDELTDAFDTMNNGLKENLNEVTRQKNQIETILLHMNDGIIAFNMEGNIIHINPAAKQLLDISDKQNNFEKIFSHIDETINMERLIYLEDWTTSESKVQINDKYLKLFFAPFKDENNRPSGISIKYFRRFFIKKLTIVDWDIMIMGVLSC